MAIDFNATYPWSGIETVTLDGQTMVKIPKFYVKYGTIPSGLENAGKKAHWVSEKKFSGYHIHPAFVRNGKVMDCFYIGAYEGHDTGNSTIGSAAGQRSFCNFDTFENARTYCSNRGAGWHLYNIYETAAINLLMLIELGTPNARDTIHSTAWHGLNSWFFHTWELVDGLKIDENDIYQIFSNQGDGTYVSTGVAAPYGAYTQGTPITEMSEASGTNFNLIDAFVPSATGSNGSYAGAYFHPNKGASFAGRSPNNGAGSGRQNAFSLSMVGGSVTTGFCARIAKDGSSTDENP